MLSDADCETLYQFVYTTHRPLAVAAGEFLYKRYLYLTAYLLHILICFRMKVDLFKRDIKHSFFFLLEVYTMRIVDVLSSPESEEKFCLGVIICFPAQHSPVGMRKVASLTQRI